MIGQRSTRQRTAISALLDELEDFRSAQQIHGMLHDRGDEVGMATVYRTLGTMAQAGELDVMHTDGGEALYLRCKPQEHHHHLICRRCGRSIDVGGPGVESFVEELTARHGFALEHSLEFFGTCARCAAAD